MMPKCQTCKFDEAAWAWQPFGPGPTPRTFTILGHHYRGFPVIKVCDGCKEDLKDGVAHEFEHKGKRYIGDNREVVEVPEYIGDALLFWEERTDG